MNLTIKNSLKDGFQVFVEPEAPNNKSITYKRNYSTPPILITIFTDGSCIKDREGNPAAGAGIWFEEDDPRNRAIRLLSHLAQTNNAGKVVAILAAIQAIPKD